MTNALRLIRGLAVAPYAIMAFRRAHPDVQTRTDALRRLTYFTRLGLAYNKVKKNANTSVVLILQQLETGIVAERAETKHQLLGLQDLPLDEYGRLSRYHHFVVVRDPYSRVLSAFLDKFRHHRFREGHGEFELTPEGFGAFLGWLEGGGIRADAHWNLQTRSLIWPLAHYHSVIRFESFASGFGNLLRARGIDFDHALLGDVLPQDAGKKTSASERLESFYTPARRTLVQRLYAEDFAALGYPA